MTKNSCRYLAIPLIGMVAACGGNDPGPVTASNCGVVSGSCTAPVTPTPTPVPAPTPLLEVSELTPYKAVGGTHQLSEFSRGGELYTAEQTKAGSDEVAVSYDPRDAVFTVTVKHEGSDTDVRFQDPAHRTDFNPFRTPQTATPNLPNMNYLQSGSTGADSSDRTTFFYRSPGTGTRYVTVAGLVRNLDDPEKFQRIRGAYVFGSQTPITAVPNRGTGTYTGSMLATMVRNRELDPRPNTGTRFEWISGTATVNVDFRDGTVATAFNGTVLDTPDAVPVVGYNQVSTGTSFTASGTASFDTTGVSYAGTIAQATFGSDPVRIAGSSLDGTFYGPDAVETGGAFRVVGSIPDQRVDIIGSFVGAKPPQ